MTIESINPATDEVLATYDEFSQTDIEVALVDAAASFLNWSAISFKDRAAKMNKAAKLLRERKEEYAVLMAKEMGKPFAQGVAESEKCAWVCEYYAENAERFLTSELIQTDASKSYVAFRPLGTLLAIMPWNFPFWQVFRAAAPSLMAGNAVVLKHASNVFGCARAIETLFRDAGFPKELFRALLIRSDRVNDIIEHRHVQAVTLTGSTAAGKAVAAHAGAALKKTVLELGGSDPYVILEDANIEEAAKVCTYSRLINNGESCIAAKRFIVVEPLRKRFEELMVEQMKQQKVGSPLDKDVTIGPLARRDLRDDLQKQVKQSLDKGAKLLLGGAVPDGKGAFYPPTVLTGVQKGMAAYDEETFGPVAAIISAKDEMEAIRIANDTAFGLGAAVFTKDNTKGERIASHELEAGACFVNTFVKSDPRLPFGGVKESGYGRELSSFGIREFVNIKTVYVR